MLKLEFPNQNHKDEYEKVVEEWSLLEDTTEISPWAMFYWSNFQEFLEQVNLFQSTPPEWFVKSTFFFLSESDKILWWIDIRHNIDSDFLNEKWWHIWYWIAPKYRGNWYATKMLELWLIEATKLWIQKALLTCDIDNIWSNKVILKNGWVFERVTSDGTANRYWIEL